jgi:hypothetical protein
MSLSRRGEGEGGEERRGEEINFSIHREVLYRQEGKLIREH